MGRIIRLHGDPHEEAERLLPWYVSGKLDPGDRAKIDAHLADCAECRAELRLERRLSAGVAGLPLDMELGWAALRGRLDLSPRGYPRARMAGAAIRRAIAWPGKLGWFAATQLALIGLAALVMSPRDRPADYHALGAAPTQTTGNAIVIFRPDTSEQDMRQALNDSRARLVDGPTSADAYVIHVPAAERAQALAKLRAEADVVLAEPIDPGAPS
jgi:anti-sigma factor RsiW